MDRRARIAASIATVGALAAVVTAPGTALAADCRTLLVDFLPAESPNPDPGLRRPLQIVAWLETPSGTFVDTVFITDQVGTYGLGNRPGRFDFNSAPLWPYGRRITVFPVWAHRHGLTFPEVVFQNGAEDNLSHPSKQSSIDGRYCAPLQRVQPAWDAASCASVGVTDKGKFAPVPAAPTANNLYPPRQDHARMSPDTDDVVLFPMLNPFDAVSQATPPSGTPAMFSWPVEPSLPGGDYVMWLEVAREFDHNATYSEAAYPAPTQIPWAEYGLPYRGQPSVVYRVPLTIGDGETEATATDYAGYGDPDGLDGELRVPDETITSDTPGSGAARLAIVPAGGYRVRVTARIEPDFGPPAETAELAVEAATSSSATLSFIAPGDDGVIGKVKTYELRYRIGGEMSEATFASAVELKPAFEVVEPGQRQALTLERLLPDTAYQVGIRAIDDCGNAGPVRSLLVHTAPRVSGEVEACVIATAAYGSPLAAEVASLRQLRDQVLRKTVLGELAVEAYYTFGPAVAGVVAESELLRATARTLLAPVVRAARQPTPRAR